MDESSQITESFFLIAQRLGREHGKPLPKTLLEVGDDDSGWKVKFNATGKPIDDISQYNAIVFWYGLPAGIITPKGGYIAAGEAANEDTLCEWLQSDLSS